MSHRSACSECKPRRSDTAIKWMDVLSGISLTADESSPQISIAKSRRTRTRSGQRKVIPAMRRSSAEGGNRYAIR